MSVQSKKSSWVWDMQTARWQQALASVFVCVLQEGSLLVHTCVLALFFGCSQSPILDSETPRRPSMPIHCCLAKRDHSLLCCAIKRHTDLKVRRCGDEGSHLRGNSQSLSHQYLFNCFPGQKKKMLTKSELNKVSESHKVLNKDCSLNRFLCKIKIDSIYAKGYVQRTI